jgi:hypothetical protein
MLGGERMESPSGVGMGHELDDHRPSWSSASATIASSRRVAFS